MRLRRFLVTFLRWRRYRRLLAALVRDERRHGRPLNAAKIAAMKQQARKVMQAAR